MVREMFEFYSTRPEAFGGFCRSLLEGKQLYFRGQKVTDAEAKEVYTAMRVMFPMRKDG